ncbi:guanylate-binding protein 3-like [Anser cygnoides]|uniref:guanylate-binding protein 3-like n=1 Tax=Anser cygnoides TaxID=8845 RepID=UPI0034D1EF63
MWERAEELPPSLMSQPGPGRGGAADLYLLLLLLLVSFPSVLGAAMQEPLCLVQNGADGVLSPNPAALEVLRGIGQPVVVVVIAGPYRTNTSFLMNRLAQQRTGFALGHTVQAQTKGIWMWCLPHPRWPDTTLVLLDTEGLGDPNKGDSHNDAWIFTLALLLSCTLVYNSLGTIDHQVLQHLGVVMALTERVQVRVVDSRDAAAADFVRFFPGFVWAVRDFVLELSQDGRRITADKYLEQVPRLQPGSSHMVQEQNELRRCLRDFFPERKCFVLPLPAEVEVMTQLEELNEGQLRPGFLRQANAFCQHIWDKAPVKALPVWQAVTGSSELRRCGDRRPRLGAVGGVTPPLPPGSAGKPGGEVRGGHRQQRGAVPGECSDGTDPTSCAAGAGGAAEGMLPERG